MACWRPVVLGSLAGGLGWGIRGQYGHETGAMIAGLLVSLTLALLFLPAAPARPVLRAVAWGTVAMGIGGSMTYGQTVGLTHDPELVGNWSALGWGLLGLAIKGGLWIGFAGFFLGLGLGGMAHRPREVAAALTGALVLCAAGIWLLNEPFDPARRTLPTVYFSDSWHWEPVAAVKPRREVWGGFLFALAGLIIYAGRRQDRLAVRLALWGIAGGAVGFPAGQCLQAAHAWNPEVFRHGFGLSVAPFINWWNFMETAFGAIMGGFLGLGLWRNRHLVRVISQDPFPPLNAATEWFLLATHVGLLLAVEFGSNPWVDRVYDFGLLLAFLPLVLIAGGRWSPVLLALPVTALPICGKTLRRLVYEQAEISAGWGWACLVGAPLAGMLALAIWGQRQMRFQAVPADGLLRPMLAAATWIYFGLNYAFCQFPWPWAAWTARTPNGLIFTACAGGLTWFALRRTGGPTTR